MSKKQITLFQTWNKTLSQDSDRILHEADKNVSSPVHQFRLFNQPSTSTSSPNLFKSPGYSTKADELADPEFDYEAGKTWIYPTNYPVRDYQFSIVKEALFKNTLVVLPTGLGKTFIAAVVMYNIYRWFPNGKVVFMAPTKPLVAQQIDACFNITGIPYENTTQMTGTNAPELRKRMWLKKCVFFLTPQVLVNDLVRNICPASSIKCLVVDEAHKALGNHAYCQVIKELSTYTSRFRVLALTATPGSETQAVKQVLTNLLISHVEMRSEDSQDVQQYNHIRDIEKIVVPLGDRLNNLKSRFLDVINVYLKRLTLRKVMSVKNPASLSKFQVLKLREAFSQNPPSNIDRATYGLAMADFSLLISLYHAYELLLLHGARTFYNFLLGILNGDKSIPHARAELLKNFEFEEIMQSVKNNYIPEPLDTNAVQNGQIKVTKKRVLPGHPKLDKLLEVVLEHFRLANFENLINTRVMIFTQYRDSVQEIVDLLNQHQPTLKAMSFIGQASKSTTNAGLTQKQQLKVIEQFRSGGYNTLVSTCVGEEGLDIGEVDLIVCYDCPKSPIRLVQRMGRTGRLRKGRIVILIAEGKEEQMYNTCEYRKKVVHRAISKGFSFAQFYQDGPSLLPPNVVPQCVKVAITIKEKKPEPKVKAVSKSPFLSDEEMDEFNQHVKIHMSDAPLLPKREFVVLNNNQGATTFAVPVKPQLSFHKWTLWQTTPQRTDMIPHSSKSLLLVRTLEHIHFPEIVNKKFSSSQVLDFTDTSFNVSAKHSKRNKHSRCSSRQSKITDCLSVSKNVIDDEKVFTDDDDDIVEIYPSPERETEKLIVPIAEVDNNLRKVPFLEQLLKVNIPNPLGEINGSNIKPPPVIDKLLSLEDFQNVNIKDFSEMENRSFFILRSLNNKIKARLKRKRIELGRSIILKSTEPSTFSKSMLSYSNKLDLIKDHSSHEIPVNINAQLNIKEQNTDQDNLEAVAFDIDFDIPDTFGDNVCFDEDLDFNKLSNAAANNGEDKLQDNKKDLESTSFKDDFLKTENQESFKHSNGFNLVDKSSEKLILKNNVFSSDDNNFQKTKEPLSKNSELTKISAMQSDDTSHEKIIAPIQCEYDSHENVKDSSSADHFNQKNSTNPSNDIIAENKSPNIINFDINFFDDDELLNFNNDIPVEAPDNLSSKMNETVKSNVNISNNNNNNGQNFVISKEYPISDEDYKVDFPVGSTVCKEKKSSVLKDVKNVYCLSESEKNVEQRSNSYIKKDLGKKSENNSIGNLQTLHNEEGNNSKNLSRNKFIPLNTECRDNITVPSVSFVLSGSKDKKLHSIDKKDDFEGTKLQKHSVCENASSTTLLYNVSSMLNNSSDNCNSSKLLPKHGNSEHSSALNEKSTFKNIYNSSTDISYTNELHLPNLKKNSPNSEKAENVIECNFDFDISFENNDLQDNSSSNKPNMSSESTKIYKWQNNSSSSRPNMSSESTKIYSFSKNVDFDDGLDEFDKDASSILEQLCSSQKKASSDLNSSFSSLTVKRCISETGRKESLKNRKKLCRTFNHTSNDLGRHRIISDTEHLKDSDVFKIPNVKSNINANNFNNTTKINLNVSDRINSHQSSLNKTVKVTDEASQYSLTQLLSFINNSENIEKSYLEKTLVKSPKHMQSILEVSDASSDDEVCPTPPKKIIKPNTEFIYNKGRSLDFNNFELPEKHTALQKNSDIIQTESKSQHTVPNVFKTLEKPQKNTNLHDSVISHIDQKNIKSNNLTNFIANTENEIKDQNIELQPSPKITFDVSFDLGFTQDEFELSGEDDMNKAILIGSSSSEEKLSGQNDSKDFFKSTWNETKKTDLLPTVPSDDINKNNKDCLNKITSEKGIPDKVIFEDSESLLPSNLDQNPRLVILNNNKIPEKCIASNSVICDRKCTVDTTNVYVQNIEQNSDSNSKRPANTNDHSPHNSEENFDDFESSIFFKLLSPGDVPATNKLSPSAEKNSECKLLENESNARNNNSLLSKNCKNIHKIENSNSSSDILNIFNHKASTSSKNNNNASISKGTKTENEFKNANLILKEKNSNELMDFYDQNVSGIKNKEKWNKDLNKHIDEFSEEKLCFDISFEDETYDLLPFESSPVNANEGKLMKNSLEKTGLPKFITESETKGEFKNITKKSIFKKNEIKNDDSCKTSFSKKGTTKFNKVNEQKGEFDLGENESYFLHNQKNISVCNGEEKTVYNVTNCNSSDEFDLHDQNQTIKTKTLVSDEQMKISKPTSTRQEKNLPKNKPVSKLNSKKKTNSQVILKNNTIIEEEEDDFQFLKKIQKKTSNVTVTKRTKRKGLSNRNEFLLSQAEVSGSDNSGHDSDYEDNDVLDGSFIDDESPPKMDYTDQHAFYLNSLKECVGLPQKFKLQPLDNNNFITQPDEACSNYEFDSFCVDDDDVVSLSSDEDIELNENNCVSKPELSKKNKSSKGKLKRVVALDSSTSSEHETSPKFRKFNQDSAHFNGMQYTLRDESPIRKPKRKRIIVSSDEEDDYTFIKPVVPDISKQSENVLARSKDVSSVLEKVPDNADSDEKIMFSIDFDDDIEFVGEMTPSVDESVQKPKIDIKNGLINLKAGNSLQKPSTSRQQCSNFDVKNSASSLTDKTFLQNHLTGLNNFETRTALQKPSISKQGHSDLDGKGTRTPAIDEEMADISFDIGWSETCPSVSNNIKTPSLNDRMLNENISCNSIMTDINNAVSVILVDSRELASGKPVISSLRNKHKINPNVMQLTAGDYVISNRVAVERVSDTEFSNHALPPKIVEKVKEMINIYVKSVVIIEKDNRKNVLSFNKNITKYLQFVTHLNNLPQVKVLFSKSTDHTSELIANLVQQERKRGFQINVPVALNANNKKLFDFYCSFPKMSPTCALNFMYYFPTIELLFKSSVEDLKKKGCISSQKAASLYKYFRNQLTFHEKL